MLSRIGKKITKYGEQFTINGTIQAKGFFQLMSTSAMRTYVDDTEIATIIPPGLYLITSADTAIAEGNKVTRDGRTYDVMRVALQRFGGTVLVKVAVLG